MEKTAMEVTVSQLIRPARPAMIVSAIFTATSAVFTLVPFVALQQLAVIWFAEGTPLGGITRPWVWISIAVVCLLLGQLLYLGGLGIAHVAEVKLRYKMRGQVVAKIRSLPLGKIAQIPHGHIRKMVCDDTSAIHTLVAHIPGDLTNAVVTLLVGTIYLAVVEWRLMLVLIGIWLLISLLVMGRHMRGYAGITERFGVAQTELAAATVEMLEGIKEIKNFQATDLTRTKMQSTRRNFSAISYEWTSQSGKAISLLGAIWRPATIFVTVAITAFWFVTQGWMNLSDTLPFFLIAPGIPSGLLIFVSLMQHLYTSNLAAHSTAQLLSEADMPEGEKTSGPGPAPGEVEFAHVTFGYEPQNPVVKDVSFRVPAKTVTALVGPSGSGKSTLARLAARFYDVDAGAVRVSGVNVREAHSSWLLSQVAIVLQDVALANETVAANIALGAPEASREAIENAAKAARIHERILELPAGYDTVLGDAGGHLSGGEKQRITLARAYLQEAPILILDEATAQADPQSERAIHQALSTLAGGKTVLIIAHRLATIQDAEQIVVLENGGVAEIGTHRELLARGGTYAAMWRAQSFAGAATEVTEA
ncbi:ABC transporter ATP-binding protein [Actinobaculum suis]|nr:ABC transporter ATP-binding protein [Actinobaculum suis]